MALASDVGIAIRNAQLFKSLETELENRRRLFINTTVALATAIDAKDHYTHGHTSRVTTICLEIANRYFHKTRRPPDQDFLEKLHIAALLHDIGKIGIDENILNKKEKLNNSEIKEINKHSEIGYRILSSVNEFSEIADHILEHQERWDGTGYPKGLKGEEISMQGRIIAIADAYDAMTSQRTYGKILSEDEAISEIKRCAGFQFDPGIAKIFIEKVLKKPW